MLPLEMTVAMKLFNLTQIHPPVDDNTLFVLTYYAARYYMLPSSILIQQCCYLEIQNVHLVN